MARYVALWTLLKRVEVPQDIWDRFALLGLQPSKRIVIPEPEPAPSEPSPVEHGVIDTRYGPLMGVLAEAIQVAFPAEAWVAAAEIAYLESGWSLTALADTRPLSGGECGRFYTYSDGTTAVTEWSAGPFQINICVHGESPDHWYDPFYSAYKAYNLWLLAGKRWTAWYRAATRLGLPV